MGNDLIVRPSGTMPLGTAAWKQFDVDGRPSFRPGDFFLSRTEQGEPVGYNDDRHVFVGAGTRSGKGTSIIIPNLLTWTGSLYVNDPKGENAMVCARRRANGSKYAQGMGQRTCILDPYNEVKRDDDDFADLKARFNPLDLIGLHEPESVGYSEKIGASFIVAENSREPFWEESARTVLSRLSLHVATWHGVAKEERNLNTVRRHLLTGDNELMKLKSLLDKGKEQRAPRGLVMLFQEMQRNMAFDGVIAEYGAMLEQQLADSPRQLMSIFGVARSNTDFIDDPFMRANLAASDFKLRDLKHGNMSLFVCLPQRYAETHYRYLRMLTNLTLSEMERGGLHRDGQPRLLMMLDEFPGMKRMASIESAAAQIAGYGVKLVMVAQTLAQMRDIYKDNWETLLASASVKIFSTNDDHFTRDYVSKLIGETEVIRTTRSTNHSVGRSDSTTTGSSISIGSGSSWGNSMSSSAGSDSRGGGSSNSSGSLQWGGNRSVSIGESSGTTRGFSTTDSWGESETVHKRALASPDEVGRWFGSRTDPRALVLTSGEQPLALKRIEYFRDELFEGLFDPHPSYAAPRTIIRVVLDRVRRKQAAIDLRRARAKAEDEERNRRISEQIARNLAQREWARNAWKRRLFGALSELADYFLNLAIVIVGVGLGLLVTGGAVVLLVRLVLVLFS